MIELARLKLTGKYRLVRMERHAGEVYVVTYESTQQITLETATSAVSRAEPTLAELEQVAAIVLGLSRGKKYAVLGKLVGVATFSEAPDGTPIQNNYLYLDDQEMTEATGNDLKEFLSLHLE